MAGHPKRTPLIAAATLAAVGATAQTVTYQNPQGLSPEFSVVQPSAFGGADQITFPGVGLDVPAGAPGPLEFTPGITSVPVPGSEFPVFAPPVGAQGEPASELYFDLSTGPLVTDNYENLADPLGTTSVWDIDMALGYVSETKYQSFAFEAGGRLEFGDYAENPSYNGGWLDPFATLRYRRESSTAFFSGGLSYRETNNGFDFIDNFDSSTDLIVDQGTRADTRANIELATGIGTPVRTDSVLSYNQRRYYNSPNPEQTDQDNFRFDGEMGLAINRASEFLIVAAYYDRDDLEDINDDETLSALGFGISTQIAPDLSFRGVIRYERDERTQTEGGERVTKTTENPTFNLSFVKERPNGSYVFTIGSLLDSNGVRTTAELGRTMELPRGELDFSIGATRLASGKVTPVGSVRWERDYRSRQLALDFSSEVRTDDDGDDYLQSRLGFELAQELTEVDGLVFNANFFAAEDFDASENDRRRMGLSISYYHDLTRDWALVTGYNHNFYSDYDNETVTKNEIFARVDRRFSLRP